MNIIIRKLTLNDAIIYLYAFFLIYMPRISELYLSIRSEFLVIVLFFLIGSSILIKNNFRIRIDKNVLYLCLGIFISAIYFVIRSSISQQDIRLEQNLFVIIQIIHVNILRNMMKRNGYFIEDMLGVLFNLALLQALIAIIMLLIPQTKDIALSLYYLGKEENVFISRMRIYGISNDYTFFTPIYHSILTTILLYYAIFKNKKYFIYIPFLLLIILLNGRFGLFVFFGGIVNLLITMGYRKIIPKKMISIMILSIIFGLIIWNILKYISPYTYEWLNSGLQDTINLFFYNQKTGNFEALAGKHTTWPKGWGIIFGEGFRLFGGGGVHQGLLSSDIGYVNDLFMGGIVYVGILYTSIIIFLKTKTKMIKTQSFNDQIVNELITNQLVISLLISNYKGEVMRSGLVLVGAILIKLILMSANRKGSTLNEPKS